MEKVVDHLLKECYSTTTNWHAPSQLLSCLTEFNGLVSRRSLRSFVIQQHKNVARHQCRPTGKWHWSL